jgi:hypothetical protein
MKQKGFALQIASDPIKAVSYGSGSSVSRTRMETKSKAKKL